jgi:glycosyltransferase involved in cell wall biosynthesis
VSVKSKRDDVGTPAGGPPGGRQLNLALFFTEGVSLAGWDDVGMFDREIALYRRLRAKGVDVSFVTYGGREDSRYSDQLDGIRVLSNAWRLSGRRYARLIPWLHRRHLRAADVIKTNQMPGAHIALRVARKLGKPLVARCGYMWSEVLRRSGNATEVARVERLEAEVFSGAAAVVVTTAEMAADVAGRVPHVADRITVIPNYVECDRFRPDSGGVSETDLVFIGRLSPEKNLENLLEAVRRSASVSIDIVGSGDLERALRDRFGDLAGRARWLGNVRNRELPQLLNRSRVFILPSHFEGHPKVLIEAMASGKAVIGADSPGIRTLIEHDRTGLLCGTDVESIRESIERLLGNGELRSRLGAAARRHVLERFDLDVTLETELDLLCEVVRDWRVTGRTRGVGVT